MILVQKTINDCGYDPSNFADSSKKDVWMECDYCHKAIKQPFYNHARSLKGTIKTYSCKDCKGKKQAEVFAANPSCMKKMLESRDATNIKKYGTRCPANNPEVQKKIQEDNLVKYGVPHAVMAPETKKKSEETCLKKYGYTNVFKSPEIQKNIKKSLLEKYGTIEPSQIHMPPEAVKCLADKDWLLDQHHIQKKCLTQIAVDLGLSATSKTVADYCKRHDIEIKKYIVSSQEKEILIYLEEIGFGSGSVETSNRTTIAPQELDLLIPSKNLGIEFCGLYWHSDIYKSKNYHQDKLKACQTVGVDLITIFEDEWKNKKDIVKKKIAHRLGVSNQIKIGARECTVEETDSSSLMLNEHIQGKCAAKVSFVLKDKNGAIVAAMTFGQPRFNTNYQWELLRFSTSCSVQGGGSKLLNAFKEKYNPQSIISYCDLRWGTGKSYLNMGFTKLRTTEPNYFYVKDGVRYSRYKFTKKRLESKGMLLPDDTRSEKQVMVDLGFSKIYDCGHDVYIWNV